MEADDGAGDTKAGTLIGTDKYGNKYYENMADELPRTDPVSPYARSCGENTGC